MSQQGLLTTDESAEIIVPITLIDNTDSPYTVLSTDYYMSCDVTSGDLTIELPNTPSNGKVFIVKDSAGNSTTNNITITTVGGNVEIDGETSRIISINFRSLNFIFNGTSYEVF